MNNEQNRKQAMLLLKAAIKSLQAGNRDEDKCAVDYMTSAKSEIKDNLGKY